MKKDISPNTRVKRNPTLKETNAWIAKNHVKILKLAERNTVRLTGKPRL
jgi:hypothetical protein